jgi:hypothetical protein
MPHAAHMKFSIYKALTCCACFTLLLVLCNGCKPRPIKPTSTCKRYAEDTLLVCSLYDTLKDKLWTADSIIINGKDYTQEVLASIGGYYVFAISGQTQLMGYHDHLRAPAYIEDGLGRVVHCYWNMVELQPAILFPLSYSGSPTALPANIYVAPLPLYYQSLASVYMSPAWGDTGITYRVLSASTSKFKIRLALPDSNIVNVFSVH